MPELWRTVAECDRYEVSSYGQVRHRRHKRILKPSLRGAGYQYIQLGAPHKKRDVHQLVCIAFHGPRPEGMLALHRNDVKTDNTPDNLYWGTPKQNAADASENGRTLRGEGVSRSKLNAKIVAEMRRLRAGGATYRAIGKTFGVAHRTVRLAVIGETWRHV